MDKNFESENTTINTFSRISNNAKELSSIEKILIKVIRRKKIFFITLLSFLVLGYIRTTKEAIFNASYQGTFTLLIKDPINQDSSGITPSVGSALFDINTSFEQDIPTLRKLLLSEFILKDIASDFNLSPKNLANRITITEDFTAKGVLDVYLQSNKPKNDEALLKELSKLYVNYATLQKQKKLSDGLAFLSAQEPGIIEKNLILRDKLEEFMKKNNLVDPVAKSKERTKMIADIESNIELIDTKTKRLESIKEQVINGNLNYATYKEIVFAEGASEINLGNPEQEISNQFENLNTELAEALLIYTPNSSIVRNIKARIETLKPLIIEKQIEFIDKAIQTNKDNNELNRLMLSKQKEEFKQLTSLIKEYSVLQFELEGASQTLSGLNKVKEKLQFDIAQDSKPWTIIKEPRFKGARIYPSFKKELTNFALFGIFSGIGLSLLRDKFDDVYHSPKEIQTDINAPILGNVPYVQYFSDVRENKKSLLEALSGNLEEQTINSYEKFFYQEALRNIYTSIRFTNSDKPLQVITLTSSIPKEGKSLTNILLAKTLSEMDLKVLQIDADLRKPQLHTRLGLNNITGLSNILTDKEITTSEATQKVPGFKNWDVITSGTKPPDPTRLLQSESMDSFVKKLKKEKKYDLVLIDTPPVIGLADSLLVSEKSDGLILIVSTDQVPRNLPKDAINKTLESGAYFIGIITNETKKPDSQLNNYAYGSYNYSYTYNAYAETDEDSKIEEKEQTKLEEIKKDLLENTRKIISKTFKWLDK